MVAREQRPGLLQSQENVKDINLISSRKDLGAARAKKAIQATARCATLYGFIKEKKWDEVLLKLDYNESDAREWIEEENDDGSTRWRSLLIHLVRLNQISLSFPSCIMYRASSIEHYMSHLTHVLLKYQTKSSINRSVKENPHWMLCQNSFGFIQRVSGSRITVVISPSTLPVEKVPPRKLLKLF